MSANSQPLVGQNRSAAPFGVVALIAGVIALAAVGIALGQGIHAAPAAGTVPPDVQDALIAQGNHAAPAAGTVPPDVQDALIAQRAGENAPLFPTSSLGPKTGLQKGLVNRYSGKAIDDVVIPVDPMAYWNSTNLQSKGAAAGTDTSATYTTGGHGFIRR